MRIIGWDSAVQEKNNGLVSAEYQDGVLTVLQKWEGKSGLLDILSEWMAGGERILLAVDSPLGWPAEFGRLLADHVPGAGLACDPADFFKRKTDLDIYKRFRKMPLEVSADRIGRSAFFTLNRIEELRRDTERDIRILWNHLENFDAGLIEVYPAATLLAGGFSIAGYKKPENRMLRDDYLEQLALKQNLFVSDPGAYTVSEHDFDALICCLAGADFLSGQCDRPPEGDPVVLKEGWCWTKALRTHRDFM